MEQFILILFRQYTLDLLVDIEFVSSMSARLWAFTVVCEKKLRPRAQSLREQPLNVHSSAHTTYIACSLFCFLCYTD